MALVIGNKKKLDYQETPVHHTLSPIVTGASTIGIFYKDGIMFGTDTLCSYGSMAKFKDIERVAKIGEHTLFASSGEYSDFQEVVDKLEGKEKEQFLNDDNITLQPSNYGHYIARLQYQKRNKFNPYYIWSIVGGYYKGKRYLASIDTVGTYVENNFVLTGFADYMCTPIINNYWNPECSEEEARQIIIQCFRNLFYRDSRASDKIQISTVNENGSTIGKPFQIDTKWDHNSFKYADSAKLWTK